jgi:hypothetical protein
VPGPVPHAAHSLVAMRRGALLVLLLRRCCCDFCRGGAGASVCRLAGASVAGVAGASVSPLPRLLMPAPQGLLFARPTGPSNHFCCRRRTALLARPRNDFWLDACPHFWCGRIHALLVYKHAHPPQTALASRGKGAWFKRACVAISPFSTINCTANMGLRSVTKDYVPT